MRPLRWLVATVVEVHQETATARTLVFGVPGWSGHRAGQHVDVRLTAPDGYSTERSYSIASAASAHRAQGPGSAPYRLELTVQRLADGEVSPYLTDELRAGDQIELRGPIGGWFVWPAERAGPTLLVAGGSGLVPLMAMIRTRSALPEPPPVRLLCSVRDEASLLYRGELARRAVEDPGLRVDLVFSRHPPRGWDRPAGRITARDLDVPGWAPADAPEVYVCGPTPMVETTTGLLVEAGHDPARIRTERFGGAGTGTGAGR